MSKCVASPAPAAALPAACTLLSTLMCMVLSVLLGGCHAWHRGGAPSIVFTRVPPGADGGPEKVDTIEGRVAGARRGQQIVLYARAGTWWVQPTVAEPFTRIEADASWRSLTHLGAEYAALLVDPGYQPAPTLTALPGTGGGVAAVSSVPGSPYSPKTVAFSGYAWKARENESQRNGVSRGYNAANVQVDAHGFLHLRVVRQAKRWTCSEVTLAQSLGYGTYSVTVEDISHFEPARIFSIFTWDEAATDPNHREMDVEISRWGDARKENARFVVQPFYIPANASRFTAPAGTLTHVLHWQAGRAAFETFRGNGVGPLPRPVASHVFTSGVPTPGGESVRMNFCVVDDTNESLRPEAELVVERFQYLP